MCAQLDNNHLEGKKKMSILKQRRMPMVLVALSILTLIVVLPIFEETRINVEISEDTIIDVSVDTQRVPLMSTIIQPSHGVGGYMINVTIVETGENFSIQNVPVGKYTIVWRRGVPDSGRYAIKVELFREALRDEFTLQVTF